MQYVPIWIELICAVVDGLALNSLLIIIVLRAICTECQLIFDNLGDPQINCHIWQNNLWTFPCKYMRTS